MDKRITRLFAFWQKKNISGIYCADKLKAQEEVLSLIPPSSTVGISGSQTLEQTGLVNRLESRGNKVFNQNKQGLSREESLELRKRGVAADYYLASANAVAQTGELVFLSAYGNRTAGISYAKNVIIVCGINKLVRDLGEALARARDYATPLNCRRLNWNSACLKSGVCNRDICQLPEYKRMCCQWLIIEAEAIEDRLRVVLVNENLGF